MTTDMKDTTVADKNQNPEAPKLDAPKLDAPKTYLKDSDQAKVDHPGGLAPAGQSGDPTVQKLLADRQAHVSNAGLEPDPAQEAVRKDALKAIDDIDEKLEELGFTAK